MTVDSTRLSHLRERARLIAEVRRFFTDRAYLEVATPIRVPSPGLDLHLDAFEVEEHAAAPPRFLLTSPEYQMKRLLVEGLPRIFQIGPCFRRGEVGPRHNPEFTMLEWYCAGASFDAMIDETETLVVAVARAARGTATLHVRDAFRGVDRVVDLTPPFERLPICRAFERHSSLSERDALALALSGDRADEERFFRVLVDEVEPALAEGPPVVLIDYPAPQASLARKKPGAPHLAERFELFVGGVELCNGFGELVDPIEQRARFLADQRARAEAGKPVYPIDARFLEALERGMPQAAGNALGVERLLMLALGLARVGDVMAFDEASL